MPRRSKKKNPDDDSFVASSLDESWSDQDDGYQPTSDEDESDEEHEDTAVTSAKKKGRSKKRVPKVTPDTSAKKKTTGRPTKTTSAKRALAFHDSSSEEDSDDDKPLSQFLVTTSPAKRRLNLDDEEEEDYAPPKLPTKRNSSSGKKKAIPEDSEDEDDPKMPSSPTISDISDDAYLLDSSSDEEEAPKTPTKKNNASDKEEVPMKKNTIIASSSSEDDDLQDSDPEDPKPKRYSLRETPPKKKRPRRPTLHDLNSSEDDELDDQDERLQRIRRDNDEYHLEEWKKQPKYPQYARKKRKRVDDQPLHERGFYCCPICYVEANRRIVNYTAVEDDDSDDEERDPIETSDFDYGPIEILESLQGGSMKQASAFCFVILKELKDHLELDHGVDPKNDIVKNDLFMRFHTLKGDGLVQRYRKRTEKLRGMGRMERYWDQHNKEQAQELYSYMQGDRADAQEFLSTFSRRAQRIWDALRQAYRHDDNCSDADIGIDENAPEEEGIEGHLNHGLLDREEEQEEESEVQAYVEDLKRRCYEGEADEIIPLESSDDEEEEDGDEDVPNEKDEDDEDEIEEIYGGMDCAQQKEDGKEGDGDNDNKGQEHDQSQPSNNQYGERDKDPGESLLGFGKHAEKTYHHVLFHDPGYVDWCVGCSNPSWHMQQFIEYALKFREYQKQETSAGNENDDDDDSAGDEYDEEASAGDEYVEEEEDQGDTRMGFGCHSQKTYRDVLTYYHGYVDFCMGCSSPSWQMKKFIDYARRFR